MIEIITYRPSENLDVLRAVEKRFGKPWREVRNSDFEGKCQACKCPKDWTALMLIKRRNLGNQPVCAACYRKIVRQTKTRTYPQL